MKEKDKKATLRMNGCMAESLKVLSPIKGSKSGLMGKSNMGPFFETALFNVLCKNDFGRIISQKTLVIPDKLFF